MPPALRNSARCADRIRERDWSAAGPAIRRSAELHLAHITQGGDPFEALEARPLDYGHWSAHRLEVLDRTLNSATAKRSPSESPSTPCTPPWCMACRCPMPSARWTACGGSACRCHIKLWTTTDTLFEGLEQFRQHLGGRLTLTMLPRIGQKIDVHEIDRVQMRAAVERVKAYAVADSSTLVLPQLHRRS